VYWLHNCVLLLFCSTFPGGDNCEAPLCNSLTVTVAGDVYATRAYTTTNKETTGACGFWCAVDDDCGDNWFCNSVRRVGNDANNRVANQTQTSIGIASTSEAASADYDHTTGTWYYGK